MYVLLGKSEKLADVQMEVQGLIFVFKVTLVATRAFIIPQSGNKAREEQYKKRDNIFMNK